MAPTDQPQTSAPDIRATYQEYTVGQTRIATIADPENAAAWIQSTATEPVEP